MIDIPSLIRKLAQLGHTPEEIADVIECALHSIPQSVMGDLAPDKGPSPGALRTKRWREKRNHVTSQSVTVTDSVTLSSEESDVTDRHGPSHERLSREPAHVVILTPPSEEILTLSQKPSVSSSPNVTTTTKSRKRRAYPEEFEEFWTVFPRKVEKVSAEKAFNRVMAGPRAPPLERVLEGARRLASEVENGRELKFVKHPTTWLNGGCWDDEPEPKGEVNGSPNRFDRWATDRQRRVANFQQGVVDFVNRGR